MTKPNKASEAMPQGLHIPRPPTDFGEKPLFRVVYAIDLDASSALEAARKALEMMRDPSSMAPVLDVLDHNGNVTRFDLCEAEANEDAGRGKASKNSAVDGALVILSVSGGVADVLFKPAGIGVMLFDYDVEGEDCTSRDPDGRACSISEWLAREEIVENKHWPIIKKAICASKRPYSREWKCPACGRTVSSSYEDLAEVGCPYCADCDTEMKLT